jgi:hypothetical protein
MLSSLFEPSNIYIYSIMHDGQPWFIAREVKDALQIQNYVSFKNMDNTQCRKLTVTRRIKKRLTNDHVMYLCQNRWQTCLSIQGVQHVISKATNDYLKSTFKSWFDRLIKDDLEATIIRCKNAGPIPVIPPTLAPHETGRPANEPTPRKSEKPKTSYQDLLQEDRLKQSAQILALHEEAAHLHEQLSLAHTQLARQAQQRASELKEAEALRNHPLNRY